MIHQQLNDYLSGLTTSFSTTLGASGGYLSISNSGRRGDKKTFSLPLSMVITFLDLVAAHQAEIAPYSRYDEDDWRAISKGTNPASTGTWTFPGFDGELKPAFESNTKPTFTALVKIICWANGITYNDDTPMPLAPAQIALAKEKIQNIIEEFTPGQRASSHEALKGGRNVIIYGAPGTGKSYELKSLPNQIRCVFHSDYLNSDFLGGYKPYQNGDKIEYRFVPGPFIQAFVKAFEKPNEPVSLIIEELNRGNAGTIFGEVFQLLDRDSKGQSEYDIDVSVELSDYLKDKLKDKWLGKLLIPSNLSLYATMNSADQGVMPLDSAFKRRWEFKFTSIKFDASDENLNKKYLSLGDKVLSWRQLGEAINKILVEAGFDEDRLIGPRFLSPHELADVAPFKNALSRKLFIYLWDDVLRHGKRDLIFNSGKYRAFSTLQAAFDNNEDVFSEKLRGLLTTDAA